MPTESPVRRPCMGLNFRSYNWPLLDNSNLASQPSKDFQGTSVAQMSDYSIYPILTRTLSFSRKLARILPARYNRIRNENHLCMLYRIKMHCGKADFKISCGEADFRKPAAIVQLIIVYPCLHLLLKNLVHVRFVIA